MALGLIMTVLLSSICSVVDGFRWKIDQVLPSDQIFTFSERYMFASHKGPALMDNSDSFIAVKTSIDVV